jgi:hypothetical protein
MAVDADNILFEEFLLEDELNKKLQKIELDRLENQYVM